MIREEIQATVKSTSQRTRWSVRRILSHIGIKESTYFRWCHLKGDAAPSMSGFRARKILPEEEQAVIGFALAHPGEGYRRLTYMMIDQDIAFLSKSDVYRILKRHDLLSRWKPPRCATRPRPSPPTASSSGLAYGHYVSLHCGTLVFSGNLYRWL